jgi:hypothetical protein
MPKGRGAKKPRKQRRQTSSLAHHQRQGKTMTPPLMQIDNLTFTSWTHTGLPECIWIAAVNREANSRSAAHGPLNVLERFLDPEEAEVLDGRISRFALIPTERRAEARAALRAETPYGLPEGLGHALALYPDCPAAWLYEGSSSVEDPDTERGVAYLKKLVAPMIPSRDPYSAELRLMVIARHAKAGKLHIAPNLEVVDLVPKYPTYLDTEDREHVEAFARNAWNILAGHVPDGEPVSVEWCHYFWRNSYEISDCESAAALDDPVPLDEESDEEDLPDASAEGVSPGEPTLADIRSAFTGALNALGSSLRELQVTAVLDTYETETDEVKLGLASRAFRLLRKFLLMPQWWTNEMAPHLIRPLVDERIVVAWLLAQDQPELYRKFKEYGAGKRKLYKLKLEELMDSDELDAGEREDISRLHTRLADEVNQDTMEEFLQIDLGGTFSGKNIREMARETDLADLYSLTYQPLSTESHGEWGSLVLFDLDRCANPLHLYHRVGRFDADPDSYIHLGWARHAVGLAEDIITEIFASLDLDASSAFEVFHAALAAASQPD